MVQCILTAVTSKFWLTLTYVKRHCVRLEICQQHNLEILVNFYEHNIFFCVRKCRVLCRISVICGNFWFTPSIWRNLQLRRIDCLLKHILLWAKTKVNFVIKWKISIHLSKSFSSLSKSIVSKRCPRSGLLSLGNSQKSQGAKLGEYGGCGTICVEFLAKWSRRNIFWNGVECSSWNSNSVSKVSNCQSTIFVH